MIVAGFGFRSSATHASLLDALAKAAGAQEGCGLQPTHVAVPADKAETASLRIAVGNLNVPLISVCAAELERVETPTQSAHVRARRGVGSIAEAVALAAAGEGAALAGPRCISSDRLAVCAIAFGGSA